MKQRWLALLCVLLLVACGSPELPSGSLEPASSEPTTTVPSATFTTSPVVIPATISPTNTISPIPTASPTVAPSPTEVFSVCSPLEGIEIDELSDLDLLKVPFQPPRPGMDDGHHGVDFAYWSRGERKEMTGLPVRSVLKGRVAGVILDRQPYGNAVIIETRLDALPVGWLSQVPTSQPTTAPLGALICPADTNSYADSGERSIYLLYAHLNKAPALEINQSVSCGQVIGEVGTTGKSVNAHLHLEARAGPASATFESMQHYTTAATEAERALYCTWRTSGLFQMFDPMLLFQ